MYKYLLTISIFCFAACNDTSEQEKEITNAEMIELENAETVELPSFNECFLRTEGDANQDTNLIKLAYDGDSVSGEMKYLPYEKDASIGKLTGIKEGNTLTLTWTYWQEGMETIEPVVLKIEKEKALQKQYTYNEKGEIYIEKNAPFEFEYSLVDCSILPERDY